MRGFLISGRWVSAISALLVIGFGAPNTAAQTVGAGGVDDGHCAVNGGAAAQLACGTTATAIGVNRSTAIGQNAQAIDNLSTSLGAFAIAGDSANPNSGMTHTTAIGASAEATFTSATAIGANSHATAVGATALGRNANATDESATAIGVFSLASHSNAAAFGAGVETDRDYQQKFGTTDNTYTMSGVATAGSRAAQTGTTYIVTSDGTGNLATTAFSVDEITSQLDAVGGQLGALSAQVGEVREGVAMAMALGGLQIPDGKSFALSLGYGNFDGAGAIGFSAAATLFDSENFGAILNAGLGLGLDSDVTGGTVGLTLAW